MIFARESDAGLAGLVKQLDALLPRHAGQKLAAFVNFIGTDSAALQADAKKFGSQHQVKNVALVVPVDYEHGPPGFKISPDAATTVMIYRGQKVTAVRSLPTGGLTKTNIRQIIADTAKMLE